MTTRAAQVAFYDAVTNGVAGPWPVYDNAVPAAATAPYVVVWSRRPVAVAQTLGGRPDLAAGWFQVTCVALTSVMADQMGELVCAAVEDRRLTFSGRVTSRIVHDGSEPAREDTSEPGKGSRFIAVDTYSIRSVPAPATA